MRFATRIFVGMIAVSPVLLHAQKNELVALQREVAEMSQQVKDLKKAQDEQVAALRALVQQALDASAKTSASVSALQNSLGDSVATQQRATSDRVVTLDSKVDGMSTDLSSLGTAVGQLSSRMTNLDSRLSDILTAVKTMNQPVAPPPAPDASSPGGAGAVINPANNPTGVSAVALYQDAMRDYSTGKDDLAKDEFTNFVTLFPQDANAPNAQFYIGLIYDRARKFPEAAAAFDAVVERFPANPKTEEAAYMKAVELQKAGRRTDAAAEYNAFIKMYPASEHVDQARSHLKELGLPAPARGGKK